MPLLSVCAWEGGRKAGVVSPGPRCCVLLLSAFKICMDNLEFQVDWRFGERYGSHDGIPSRERSGSYYIALFFMFPSLVLFLLDHAIMKSNRLLSKKCSVQSLSRVQLFVTPWTALSTPGLPVHHQLPESTQTHIHWVGDAIQTSHPLSSPSPPTFNLSQNQGLFQWVSSLHQVAKVLEFQRQHQSFQWTPRTDLL